MSPPTPTSGHRSMISRVHRATLLALYQLAIVFGIAAMPIALATHRFGVSLPIHRLLVRLEEAYENTDPQ